MSRIFDALQRSEGERSGDEASKLAQGPELLRRAEERATSKWEGNSPHPVEGKGLPPSESSRESTQAVLAAAISQHQSAEERLALLSRFESISVSLDPESRLVSIADRESPTAEALRLLSVRLRDMRRLKPLKKVLVTSTIPREGKTTISANLACALAHGSDERILVIEGDVRLPALRQMFGLGTMPGLCELIQDGRKLVDCVFRLDGAGVWILTAGRPSVNPLELLQSPRLSEAMAQLSTCFDWIIIDSPPVLPLADTSIWMRLADGILLVTRQGTTEKQQLQSGLEALEPQKVLGALLNGAIGSAYSSYYYRTSGQS